MKEAIKKQVLELSRKERAKLAHFLIDSLNPDMDFESEEAWSQELKDSERGCIRELYYSDNI